MSHRVSTDVAGRSRKGRALLAGGAVLGLGAVATLAAWSDDVWVVSSFTTTPFGIEAAVDLAGTVWHEYPESPGGSLEFKLEPSAMTPGEPVFAPLGLRLSTGETDALVSMESAPTSAGLSGNDVNFFNKLGLTLHRDVSPADCSLGNTSAGTVVAPFTKVPLSTLGQNIATLPADTSAVRLCFEVELDLTASLSERNGSTGTMSWTFHAEPAPDGP